jgi:hypothetical protein
VVDVTLDVESSSGGPAAPGVLVKLQAETWELNLWAPLADLARLREVRDADWAARRSLAIGTCAGAPVYWAMSGWGLRQAEVVILVGHDDETWDVAVGIPLATADEIASLAQRHL